MHEIPFSALADAVAGLQPGTSLGTRLKVAAPPNPFVEPTLLAELPTRKVSGEIIFVEAAAAVGKSTIASHLSGSRNIPLLDLARVPVSTGSLKALLMDVGGFNDPIAAFHAGQLPIIVDALDEGRLRSSEAGFESFLETTAELLLENRSAATKPKLICFGRYESTSLADMGLRIAGNQQLNITKLQVGFFGEAAAWELITAYASAEPDSAFRQHPEPAKRLISAYFEAIEEALGLAQGKLWASEQGKAFAGYAPVLAAVGSLLAKMDNFQEVTNRLKAAGAREAWEVIETVLTEILRREQSKLTDKLAVQINGTVPAEAYDPSEQLTLLTQYVHRIPLTGTGRVKLAGSDQSKYQAMVELYVPEHPFVRQHEFGNEVLGSVVTAHAVIEDILRHTDLDRTAALSRQPFLWRAFVQRIGDNALIDGLYVGYVLNSYWSDPVSVREEVNISSVSDHDTLIHVPTANQGKVSFTAVVPITLYAQIKDCWVDVFERVRLVGHAPRGSASVFFVRGDVTIICEHLDADADTIRFDGKAWLEAQNITASARLNLHVNGSKVGWGGAFRDRFPWNAHRSTLEAPYHMVLDDPLKALVNECGKRLPAGTTVTVHPDLSPSDSDPQMRWVVRRFSKQFPPLLRVLIDHGKAQSAPVQAAGRGKVRVRFDFAWSELLAALEQPERHPDWAPVITAARRAMG